MEGSRGRVDRRRRAVAWVESLSGVGHWASSVGWPTPGIDGTGGEVATTTEDRRSLGSINGAGYTRIEGDRRRCRCSSA